MKTLFIDIEKYPKYQKTGNAKYVTVYSILLFVLVYAYIHIIFA